MTFFILHQFLGVSGEKFKQACALYCGNQSVALAFIKEKCKKENKFNALIQVCTVYSLVIFRSGLTDSLDYTEYWKAPYMPETSIERLHSDWIPATYKISTTSWRHYQKFEKYVLRSHYSIFWMTSDHVFCVSENEEAQLPNVHKKSKEILQHVDKAIKDAEDIQVFYVILRHLLWINPAVL